VKKRQKLLYLKDIILFFTSMFLTIILLSLAAVYFFSYDTLEAGEAANEGIVTDSKKTVLFCDIDNNVSYEFTLDFAYDTYRVKRLYFDNSVYNVSGFSGMKMGASEFSDGDYNFAIAVTETQHAALIDYVGGVAMDIDEKLSSVCGGISTGYHDISGITAIKIYQKESENEEVCLAITEEVFVKWCGMMGDENSFYKLLRLCENDFSYTDFIELSKKVVECVK